MISLIRAAWQEELRVPMFVGLSTDGYPDSDDPAMKNGARCYHMDTGAEYEYSADDDAWYPIPSGSSWGQLTDKPFSAIGTGLEVDSDDNLNVVGQIIDVGSNYYMYESYFLPAINVTDLRTIYANHKENKSQVVKWTLLGSETYFNILSADYIAGIYSLDILVHNKYHCQYNFEDSTTGVVNPEVLKDDIETFVFKGYVSSTQPTGTLKQNELWYQGSILPIVFPIQVKRYDGSAWSAETESYTPSTLDMWADLENDHGYYWFGNDWNIIDVNVNYDNVTIGVNAQGQLEVKTDVIPTIQAMNNAIANAIDNVKLYFVNKIDGQENYEKVAEAFESGKLLCLKYNNRVYICEQGSYSDGFAFMSINNNDGRIETLLFGDPFGEGEYFWGDASIDFQKKSFLATNWNTTTKSSNNHYPSTKLVYDSIFGAMEASY